MSIYIIHPKETLAERSLALSAVSMAPENREAQIAELARLRAEDPVYMEIHRWIVDYQGSASNVPKTLSVPIPAGSAQVVMATSTVEASKVALTARRRGVRASQGIKAGNSPNISKVRDSIITGTIIVDIPDEEAERMRRELPDVQVLRDAPIDLIRPGHVAATVKRKVTASDLWHLEAIGLKAARKRKQGFQWSGTGVTIAVLDTGIDQTHVELSGKVVDAFTFDARPDVWAAQPMIPPVDTDGHGTHVAGLICGKTVGVAPGAKLLSGVMIPEGRGMLSDFVLALAWAASQPEIQIVNMSAGIHGYIPEMHSPLESILRVGVLPVFAVGNEGRNRTRSPGNYSEVVSVGAADRKDGRYGVAGFSSGGTLVIDYHQYQVPDIIAPGKGVYSSVIGGEYEAWDGTSMATPIVSGVAALILERNPKVDVLELEDELLSSCLDLGLPADRQGRGLVQVKVDL